MCSVKRQAENIVGMPLLSLEDIYIQRLTKKIALILNDDSHPAKKYLNNNMLPSGRRLRHFKGAVRFTTSTYPQAVKLFNSARNNRL